MMFSLVVDLIGLNIGALRLPFRNITRAVRFSLPSIIYRAWKYQNCYEFGLYFTSDGNSHPFGHSFDLMYQKRLCQDVFNIEPPSIHAGFVLDLTSTREKEDSPRKQLTNIMFTYGSADPWKTSTITESSKYVSVVRIENATMCADVYSGNNTTDSASLKQARIKVDMWIQEIIKSYNGLEESHVVAVKMQTENELVTCSSLGDDIDLKVNYSVAAADLTKHQWFFRNDRPSLSFFSNYSANTTALRMPIFQPTGLAILTLNNLQAQDTGEYIFRLTADDLVQELTFQLCVMPPSRVRIDIQNANNINENVNPRFLQLNESYIVRCTGQLCPLPGVRFEWSQGCVNGRNCDWMPANQTRENQDRITESTDEFGINYTSITIAQTHGSYRCICGARMAQTEYMVSDILQAQLNKGIRVYLIVQDSSGAIFENSSVIYEGDTVIARCQAQKYVYQKPEWLGGQGSRTIEHQTPYSNSLDLVFDSITLNHSNAYTCTSAALQPGIAEKRMERISIHVLKADGPDFGELTSPLNLEANLTSSIQIKCDPLGVPRPKITWLKNYQPIMSAKHIEIIDHGLIIQINRITHEDVGVYICRLQNAAGISTRNFSLTVIKPIQTTSNSTFFSAVMASLVAIVIILAAIVVKLRLDSKKKAQRQRFQRMQTQLCESNTNYQLDPEVPVNQQAESLPYNPLFEIPYDHLTTGGVLGQGNFGIVYKGKLKPPDRVAEHRNVAVKTPRDGRDADHLDLLLKELKILIYVGRHINVVGLVGAITTRLASGQLYVVTEFCEGGSLDRLLRKHRGTFRDEILHENVPCDGYEPPIWNHALQFTHPMITRTRYKSQDDEAWAREIAEIRLAGTFLCTSDLQSFGYQLANGMEFLASKNIIHRDLAARNILVDKHGVKISDFGLSRRGETYFVTNPRVALPTNWLALETLSRKEFSKFTDIWSFGILLWEIFTLAKPPFPDDAACVDLIQWLADGNRLPPPDYAPDEIYHLMCKCWDKNPVDRPSFAKCKEILANEMSLCCPRIVEDLMKILHPNGENDFLSPQAGYEYGLNSTPERNESAGNQRTQADGTESLLTT